MWKRVVWVSVGKEWVSVERVVWVSVGGEGEWMSKWVGVSVLPAGLVYHKPPSCQYYDRREEWIP